MADEKKPQAVPDPPAPTPWEAYGAEMARVEQNYTDTIATARAERKAGIKAAKNAREAAIKAQRAAQAKPADSASEAAA